MRDKQERERREERREWKRQKRNEMNIVGMGKKQSRGERWPRFNVATTIEKEDDEEETKVTLEPA